MQGLFAYSFIRLFCVVNSYINFITLYNKLNLGENYVFYSNSVSHFCRVRPYVCVNN
jgi:hypothetical protein